MITTINSKSMWISVLLTILPGIWLTLQQDLEIANPGDVLIGSLLTTILIALIVGAISLLKEHRLGLSCAPLLGVLAWKYADFLSRLGSAERFRLYPFSINVATDIITQSLVAVLRFIEATIAWPVILFFVLSVIMVLIWFVRNIIDGITWRAICLVLLLMLDSVAVLSVSPPLGPNIWILLSRGWLNFIFTLFVGLIILLFPIALGAFWAAEHGLKSGLAILSFEPVWLYLLNYEREPIYHLLHEYTPRINNAMRGNLEWALLALSYLPILLFFVIIPAGLLLSRSRRYQIGWLVVAPLVVNIILKLIPGFATSGTPIEFSTNLWIQQILTAFLLWLPLPLAAILYESTRKRAEIKMNWQGATASTSNTIAQ